MPNLYDQIILAKDLSKLQGTTDLQLVEVALVDPEKFSLLIIRYEKLLKIFLRANFNVSEPEIEDMVQESFMRAYLGLASFNREYKWKTWLYTIALNVGYNFVNKPRSERLEDYEQTLFTYQSRPDQLVEDNFNQQKIKKALLTLSKEDYVIIDLFFLKEYSLEELVLELRLSVTLAKIKISRASAKFKAAYFSLK